MSNPVVGACPRCRREITARDLVGAVGNCPGCGAELELDGVAAPPVGVSEADAADLEGLDLELIKRLAQIPREHSWQLVVMGELAAAQARELREFLDRLPVPPVPRGFAFRRKKTLTKQLSDPFEGLLMALGGLQDVFRREMVQAQTATDLRPLRAFGDRLGVALGHLRRFQEQAVRLEFPRGSRHGGALAVLLTWTPGVVDELTQVAERLQTHGRLPRARLHDWPVQVTLAPPTLPAFFAVYQELRKD
jgi:hypothetical protein